MRKAICFIVVGIVGLIGAYVGTYIALVQPHPIWSYMLDVPNGYKRGWNVYNVRADFRFGGDISQKLFSPVVVVDKQVRVDYWTFTDDEMDALYPNIERQIERGY